MTTVSAIMVALATTAGSPEINPDFIFMIEHAVQAPSGHNTQPWLFKLGKTSIEIHPDTGKALPVVDPENRELFISLGCALENICIAASVKGYGSQVDISPGGIITVNLSGTGSCAVYDSFFTDIPRRQTNRSEYTGRRISADTIKLIEQFIIREEIPAMLFAKESAGFGIIKSYIAEGNRLQMGDGSFKNELKNWMRYNKKQKERYRDGLAYDAFGAPNLPLFISKPAIGVALNAKRQIKTDTRKIDSSSHLVLFTLHENSIPEWISLGQRLQRFLLQTTALGIAAAFMNQPNEIPVLAAAMADELGVGGRIPAIILRIGYAGQMPYSARKNITDSILSGQ